MSYSGSSQTHIDYANVVCPYCGAEVTQPCRSETGRSWQFRYTHAGRVTVWWWRRRATGQR